MLQGNEYFLPFRQGNDANYEYQRSESEYYRSIKSIDCVWPWLESTSVDNTIKYINKTSLPKVREWIRYRARAIVGVKGNFRHSHVNNMGCRLCSQDSDETQEH